MSPDHLTVLGLLVSFGAAWAIAVGKLNLGFALVILAAVPDLLDGALAKASNTTSQRGAFFDSVIGRVTDAVLLGGVAWYFGEQHGPRMAVLPFAVMAASSVISYERAKAESLGLNAKGGLMERAERIILLCFGLLFSPLFIAVMWVMLALTILTAIQRFIRVWKQAEVSSVTQVRRDARRVRQMTRHSARERRREMVARRLQRQRKR